MDFPTKGPNTLDIFITNRPSIIDMCIPIDGISDHGAILTNSQLEFSCVTLLKDPSTYGPRQTSIKLDILFWHFAMNFVYLFCHYSYQHVMEQIFRYLYSMSESYSNQDEFIKITSAWDNQSDQRLTCKKASSQ